MKKRILRICVLLVIPLLSIGCPGAISLISLAPEALRIGTLAYNAVEKADISAAVSPGITKEELNQIKHVALVFGGERPAVGVGGGDLSLMVGDSVGIELMKLGFQVSDRQKLKAVLDEQHLQMSGLADVRTAAKIGKIIGADAIITGNVTGTQTFHTGMFGGRMSTVVQNASLKIIGVERADTLMAVTINYKKGQPPNIAAESIAAIVKAKLENPFVDVKEILKRKKEEG